MFYWATIKIFSMIGPKLSYNALTIHKLINILNTQIKLFNYVQIMI